MPAYLLTVCLQLCQLFIWNLHVHTSPCLVRRSPMDKNPGSLLPWKWLNILTYMYLHLWTQEPPSPWQHSYTYIFLHMHRSTHMSTHMSTAMYVNTHCASQHYQWPRTVAVPHPSPFPGQCWDFLGGFEENGIGGRWGRWPQGNRRRFALSIWELQGVDSHLQPRLSRRPIASTHREWV